MAAQHVNNGIIYNDISDHFPIFSTFSHKPARDQNKIVKVKYRKISDDNINRFKNDLLNVQWDLILNTNNAEVAYSNFMLIFQSQFFKNFPIIEKNTKAKSVNKQYINSI